MSRHISYAAAVALSAIVAAPVLAQTMSSPSTSSSAPSDTGPAATAITSPARPPAATTTAAASNPGYVTADQQLRASKLIGSSVYNEQHQKIGSVDELLIDQTHNVTGVVLSVGGFLGIGSKLVKVPYSELHVTANNIVLQGATKQELTQMPTYRFSTAG